MEATYFRSGAVVFDDFSVVLGASPLPGPDDQLLCLFFVSARQPFTSFLFSEKYTSLWFV